MDLRRPAAPGMAALFCERAARLPREQRMLVESVFREGRSLMEIACLTGASGGRSLSEGERRLEARRLARRLKAVLRRLSAPLFVFVASRTDRASELGATGAWPAERCLIAERVVLHGEPAQGVARSMGLTLYAVRAHLRAVEAMHAGASS